MVSINGGEGRDVHVARNDAIGGWRLGLQVAPRRAGPIEMRAFLREKADILTETWSYAFVPEPEP